VAEKQANGKAREEPAPPRKRGRPKGLPKTGGRQKKVMNWNSAAVRERLLPVTTKKIEAIINGDKILTTGPTGKEQWRRPTVDQQLKAAELAYRKCLADLRSTTLQGPGEAPLIPREEHSPRDLARAVLGILQEAEIDEHA